MAATGVAALLIGALSAGVATAAQAAHAGSASPGRYVARVMVLPGGSLWSVAEAAEPDADPRAVIDEIQQLNSMAGDQVRAGQVLWVPRGRTLARTRPSGAATRRRGLKVSGSRQGFWLR
jgi:hypothetical protein